MFTYLITPNSKEKTATISIRVVENSITAYVNNDWKEYAGNAVDKCLGKKAKEKHLEILTVKTAKKRPDHAKLHNTIHADEERTKSFTSHFHVVHNQPITATILKAYFADINACQTQFGLSTDVILINHNTAKDIYRKFREYEKVARKQRQESLSMSLWYTNDPYYLEQQAQNYSLPSIFQHQKCLLADSLGCKFIAPLGYWGAQSEVKYMTALTTVRYVMLPILLMGMGFLLFNRYRQNQVKPNSPFQDAQIKNKVN